MCGIVGALNYSKSISLDLIGHRGPDDQGHYKFENVDLGHVRLSIQDLSERGHQPLHSPDGQYTIIFNGEIYNHWEIRAELEKKGYQFSSTSDTETVLLGFVEFGVDVIPMLNGIFAFCILDKNKREIVIARDRFGVKPLYFFHEKNVLGFASELKALIPMIEQPLEVNPEAMKNYLRFLWSPGEETPLKQTKKLLQGRYMVVSLDHPERLNIVKYYQSGFKASYSPLSESELIDQLDKHLTRAVERQLLSDVPIGFFLSGGLDSSLLVAIAKKLNPEKSLQCFTIETEVENAQNTDDLTYARKVADYLKVNLEIVKADLNIVRDFDKMINHLDEPLADPAALNVLNISRRARAMGFKVLIGGTAGDDLFSGYRRHQALRFENLFQLLPSPLSAFLGRLGSKLSVENLQSRRLRKMLETLSYSRDERIYAYFEWFPNQSASALFVDGLLKKNAPAFPYFEQLLKEIPATEHVLNQMLHLELNTFLVDHNLNYTDKMGMAVAVEIRVPFLDNDLVDFSAIIPPHLKMKGRETKYILKKVAERYLPREVIYRDKTGFGAPVRKWIRGPLREMISSRLSTERLETRGLFNAEKVRKMIQLNQDGKIDASYSIWALLAIDSWLEQFYDAQKETVDGSSYPELKRSF